MDALRRHSRCVSPANGLALRALLATLAPAQVAALLADLDAEELTALRASTT